MKRNALFIYNSSCKVSAFLHILQTTFRFLFLPLQSLLSINRGMRYFTLSVFVALSLSVHAQHRVKNVRQTVVAVEKSITDRYLDSLKIFRARQDSVLVDSVYVPKSAVLSTEEDAPRLFRLFTPLKFYPDLAHRHFSLSPDEMCKSDEMYSVDKAMMNIYVYHPELVTGVFRTDKNEAKKEAVVEKKKIEVTPPANMVVTPDAGETGFKPVNLVIKRPNFWKLSGEFYFQTMQNYYSQNWYQGGESNYSVLGRATIQANYNNKQKVRWENKLEMQLGFQTSKSDTVHNVKTSTDLLRYTGKLGLQATKKWYYTVQVVASSQFMRSFAANSNNVNSDFLSPLNVNLSIGMDYNFSWLKNRLTGNVHLAPLAFDYRYVDRLNLSPRNGIEEGHHSKRDYGSTFTMNANWRISDNINWSTRLYGFTSYKYVNLQWENTINLKISKVITTSIYLYPRFDDSNPGRKDDGLGYFQFKEYTSIGLAYSF